MAEEIKNEKKNINIDDNTEQENVSAENQNAEQIEQAENLNSGQETESSETENFEEISEEESGLDELALLKIELEKSEKEKKELKDKYLRELAEIQNFKKRQQQQMNEMKKYVLETFVSEILPVMDSFGRAFEEADKADTLEKAVGVIKGLKMIEAQMENVLKKNGLEKYSSVNEEFNPDIHQAIQMEDVEDEKLDNKVVCEMQAGYKLNGKIIRHSLVKVGKFNK